MLVHEKFDPSPQISTLEQYGGDFIPNTTVAARSNGRKSPMAAIGLARTLNQSLESIQSEVSRENNGN